MSWDIKLDGNKAIDQMKELAEKAWKGLSNPSTAVVVELLNQTTYDFRHVGNYRWQGNFMEPTDNVKAGYGRVWGMESKGFDGCFGAVNYELWDKHTASGIFLSIGNLIYWDGAQPKYTALVSDLNVYNEGKPKNLELLDKGKSGSWNYKVDNLTINIEIWREKITSIEENFRIQITQG